MDEDKLFNLIMKSKKASLASFMTGYFIELDEESIQGLLKGIQDEDKQE